jgi:ABC-type antimicrobial peptide transport system permease subunit
MRKTLVFIGLTVGSTVGGYVPSLWHASYFSFSGILFSVIGGIAGIIAAFKIREWYF